MRRACSSQTRRLNLNKRLARKNEKIGGAGREKERDVATRRFEEHVVLCAACILDFSRFAKSRKARPNSMRFSYSSMALLMSCTFAIVDCAQCLIAHCNLNKEQIQGRRKMEISVAHIYRQSVQKIRTLTRCSDGRKRLSVVSLLESRSHLT